MASMLGLLLALPLASGCTTLLVGRGASAKGHVLGTYSSDGGSTGDTRLVKIPPRPGNRTRPVWDDREDYPRYVGYFRGAEYTPEKTQKGVPAAFADRLKLSEPIGYIPENVTSTYGYFETAYNALNDAGVGMTETSCSARLFGSRARGAIMSIDELSRIAAERCASARCAVATMGELAETYGFYGETERSADDKTGADTLPYPAAGNSGAAAYPFAANEGGETLGVLDKDEAWVFHVLSDGEDKPGAVWAAQRVPDGEVAVVANMFTIREVNLNDTDNFMYSSSMTAVAQKRGWWSPGQKLDFTATFSSGEYGHMYYSGRRMWRAIDMLAPSLGLEPEYKAPLLEKAAYPFSFVPDAKVSVAQLKAVHRDTLRGTPYEMGAGGGPFGSPARFKTVNPKVKGSWERTIGIYRTDYTYVLEMRAAPLLPTMWFGPHAAYGTCFVPFFSGMPSVPHSHSSASTLALDRTTALWAHRYALNVAYSQWSTMGTVITSAQTEYEALGEKLQAEFDRSIAAGSATPAQLYAASELLAMRVTEAWSLLPDEMIFRFSDGYVNDAADAPAPGHKLAGPGQVEPTIYPADWLQRAGWPQGPGYGPAAAAA